MTDETTTSEDTMTTETTATDPASLSDALTRAAKATGATVTPIGEATPRNRTRKAAADKPARSRAAQKHGQDADRTETNADKVNVINEAAEQATETVDQAIEAAAYDTQVAEYKRAIELRKQGARGKGVKITDPELVEWAAKAATARPLLAGYQQLEIAYWIDRLALNRDRFMKAWEPTGIPFRKKDRTV